DARPSRGGFAAAGDRGEARKRCGGRRGGESRRAGPLRAVRAARVPAGADRDLSAAARGGFRRRPCGAGSGDSRHRAPRARALLRARRGSAGRARLRLVVTAWNVVAVAAAVVGVIVLILFFLGP